MRILVADNHEDGMFKCRKELLEALTSLGEVHISLPEGKYTKALMNIGCVFEKLEIDRRGMNPIHEITLIRAYGHLLNKVMPDVVLTYSIKPNIYLGFLCAKKRIPYIANITGLGSAIENKGLYQKIVLLLYRIGLRKAYMVFFQNKKNRDFMLKQKVYSGKYDVIPGSGVNLNQHKFEVYPEETKALRFLTIGRIMKDKGTDELLSAARIVKSKFPEVSFSLIGFFDGDYEKKIKNAELEGIVKYHGHQDDVHSYITNSHAIVHPSYHEGMANALLEGASAGRPVIATDVPGCIETFTPDETGFACKARDAESLTEAIIRFIELPYQEKIKMGIAGRRKMESEFSRDIVVKKYLNSITNLKGATKNESL